MNYKADSAFDLAKTIDAINDAFKIKLHAGEVHTLYTHDMMCKGYNARRLDHQDEVVAATVWGREYRGLIRHSPVFDVKFIHGHDSDDPEQGHHVTLNEQLGKYAWHEGTMLVYVTDGAHA